MSQSEQQSPMPERTPRTESELLSESARKDQDSSEAQARQVSGRKRLGSSKTEGKDEEKPRTLGAVIREYALIIVVALVLSFLVKTFITRPFYIPSGSMEQTLEIGDRVFVNKMVDEHDLHRGDIVVFHDGAHWQPRTAQQNPLRTAAEWVGLFPADSNHYLVKRVIGLPGDHVKTTADGKISVNGTVVDEPYLYPGDQGSLIAFDVVVPEGKLWVMGDHRSNSADSRYHMQEESKGFVSEDEVEGTVGLRMWPLNRFGNVESSQSAFDSVPAPSGK